MILEKGAFQEFSGTFPIIKELVDRIIIRSQPVPYFCFNVNFVVCTQHNTFVHIINHKTVFRELKVRIDVLRATCVSLLLRTFDLQTKSANMAALKIAVFFFVDVLMIASAAEIELNNEVTLLRDSQLGEFSAQFMRHDKHRLTAPQGIHGTTTKEESCISCGLTCGRFTWCFSFNCGINPGRSGKHVCEILSTDKYNNSEGFHPSQEFHHFSIVVSHLIRLFLYCCTLFVVLFKKIYITLLRIKIVMVASSHKID